MAIQHPWMTFYVEYPMYDFYAGPLGEPYMPEQITDERIEENVSEMTIERVAYNLAGVNRFAGGGHPRYSSLQHSLAVGCYLEHTESAEVVLAGFVHDAHDAVTNDVRKPFKAGEQREVENRVQAALLKRLGMPDLPLHSQAIKDADRLVCMAEGRAIGMENRWFHEHTVDGLAERLTGRWMAERKIDPEQQVLQDYWMEKVLRLSANLENDRLCELLNEKDLSEMRDEPTGTDQAVGTGTIIADAHGNVLGVAEPPAESPAFTDGDFRLYQVEYGKGTMFWVRLFRAIEEAMGLVLTDGEPFAPLTRLALGFPDEVRAVQRMTTEPGYWKRLAEAYRARK